MGGRDSAWTQWHLIWSDEAMLRGGGREGDWLMRQEGWQGPTSYQRMRGGN